MTIGIVLLIIGFCTIMMGIVFIKDAKLENISDARKLGIANEKSASAQLKPKVSENTSNTAKLEITNERNDSKQRKIAKLENTSDAEKSKITNEKDNSEQSKTAILNSLITVATADGQLTNNEQKILQERATELGLNYFDFTTKIDELLQLKQQDKETNIIDKKKEKGDDFEKYIVQKFSNKYFTIIEWAGDKFIDGKYAGTTLHPDLKIKFKHKDIAVDFAVECKYRTDYYKNGIEWCSERQLLNYKKFAIEKNIVVFIAIGISGLATEPNELYIIPLEKIETVFLSREFLSKFRKSDKNKGLFFDGKTSTLR